MAKSLKSILGNDKKLEGVKSSSTEKLDLGGFTPKAGDEEKFVKKHSLEKFADRVGNGDAAYKPSTKEAPYHKQDAKVYEDATSDQENLPADGAIGNTPASAPRLKKKKLGEDKIEITTKLLEHLASKETMLKFKNGEKAIIDEEVAATMLNIFTHLSEDNKAKFIEHAFSSPQDFLGIAELKG